MMIQMETHTQMMKQIKHKNPLQFDSVYNILSHILGEFDDVEHFAAHICHEPTDNPFYQTVNNLLEQNIHIHALLTALSACEKNRLQYAFDSTKRLPASAQLSSAKKIINHFNNIQDALLAAADTYFDDIVQRLQHDVSGIQADTGNRSSSANSVEQKTYQQTITDSIDIWQQKKLISIHNYYYGLTIRSVATFLTGSHDSIQIQLNEEIARVFAIHPSETDAFAVCEGEKVQVRLSIKDISHNVITLGLGKIFPLYAEERKHLSIQIQEHIPVTISMGKKRVLHARLHDLSIGGIGISVHGINQAPYNIGDKVECQLTLNAKPMHLQGTVRWTGSSNDEARIGIELQHLSKEQHFIQKEVFRMQRNIINSINQLELPGTLKDAVAAQV